MRAGLWRLELHSALVDVVTVLNSDPVHLGLAVLQHHVSPERSIARQNRRRPRPNPAEDEEIADSCEGDHQHADDEKKLRQSAGRHVRAEPTATLMQTQIDLLHLFQSLDVSEMFKNRLRATDKVH